MISNSLMKESKKLEHYPEDRELFSFLVIASFKITNSALKALWHVWRWLLHLWLGLWWDCFIVRSEGVRKGKTILVFEILPFCIWKLWAKLHVVIYITNIKKGFKWHSFGTYASYGRSFHMLHMLWLTLNLHHPNFLT